MDLCACVYEVDDPVDNLHNILMTIMLMIIKIYGHIFLTLWWWWLTWRYLKPRQIEYSRFDQIDYMSGTFGKGNWKF